MHDIVESASKVWRKRKEQERSLRLNMYRNFRDIWTKHLAKLRKDKTASADDIAAMERLIECAASEERRAGRHKTPEQVERAREKNRERQRRFRIAHGHVDPDESRKKLQDSKARLDKATHGPTT